MRGLTHYVTQQTSNCSTENNPLFICNVNFQLQASPPSPGGPTSAPDATRRYISVRLLRFAHVWVLEVTELAGCRSDRLHGALCVQLRRCHLWERTGTGPVCAASDAARLWPPGAMQR